LIAWATANFGVVAFVADELCRFISISRIPALSFVALVDQEELATLSRRSMIVEIYFLCKFRTTLLWPPVFWCAAFGRLKVNNDCRRNSHWEGGQKKNPSKLHRHFRFIDGQEAIGASRREKKKLEDPGNRRAPGDTPGFFAFGAEAALRFSPSLSSIAVRHEQAGRRVNFASSQACSTSTVSLFFGPIPSSNPGCFISSGFRKRVQVCRPRPPPEYPGRAASLGHPQPLCARSVIYPPARIQAQGARGVPTLARRPRHGPPAGPVALPCANLG